MVINEELFSYILDFYPNWGNSPEHFLEFVKVTFALSKLDGETRGYESYGISGSEQDLAGVFIRVFEIDLSPYTSFQELQHTAAIEIDVEKVLTKMSRQSRKEDQLYDLLEDTGTEPSKETVIDDLYADALLWSIINRLRPYIDFRKI